MSYKLFLGMYQMPITPSKVELSIGDRNETLNLVDGRQITIPLLPSLTTVKFDLLFPARYYPFVTTTPSGLYKPSYYAGLLEEFKVTMTPFFFRLVREGAFGGGGATNPSFNEYFQGLETTPLSSSLGSGSPRAATGAHFRVSGHTMAIADEIGTGSELDPTEGGIKPMQADTSFIQTLIGGTSGSNTFGEFYAGLVYEGGQNTSLKCVLKDWKLIDDADKYGGDMLASITLTQYVDYGTTTITRTSEGEVEAEESRETENSPAGKTYTVKSGDTLSTIAATQLGNATRWTEIYDLNREVIEAAAVAHGYTDSNHGNRIWAGTELKIPAS